jgi:hypothetical protein
VLVIPFLLGLQNTNNSLEKEQSLCPLKMATGFPCPSCGITKSIVYFYDGNILKSISYHILGPIVVPFCVFLILLLLVEIKTGNVYFNKWFYNKKAACFLAGFLIIYHSIRLIFFIRENSLDSILEQSIWR